MRRTSVVRLFRLAMMIFLTAALTYAATLNAHAEDDGGGSGGSSTKVSAYIDGDWFGEEKPYYCGPAAVQTALQRRLKTVPPSQNQIASVLTTNTGGTDSSRQIMWGLNSFGNTDWYHAMTISEQITPYERESWRNDVVYNIDHGYPVVVNLIGRSGAHPPKWPDRLVYHYVTVVGYLDNGRQLRVVDSAAGGGGGLSSDWAQVDKEWTAPTDDVARWMQGKGYAAHPAPGSAAGRGPETGPVLPSAGSYVMWGDSANVRKAPGTGGAVVTTLRRDTIVRVQCQRHAQLVSAEGTSNDAWSYLPEYQGWITNIYLYGPAWLPGVSECPPSMGGGGGSTYRSWDTVNVRTAPGSWGSVVRTLPGGTTLKIQCQKHAQLVPAEGISNDAWSYLPDHGGWITNIYVEGPAWLPGVAECGADVGGGAGGTVRTWGSGTNVRSQPSTASNVLRTLSGGVRLNVQCQKHGQSVSAEGTVNDAWSYLPEHGGWISNIYIEGPAWIPGIPECAGAIGGPSGGSYRTWGDGANVRTQPSSAGGLVKSVPGGTTLFVACQVHGQSVTSEGTTNDAWSYLPEHGGWITNIYIEGPAWIPGVPDCDTLAVNKLEPRP
ncbi:C39 family peptidase [Streptomyces sp. NBC_00207]|uniref:C39 family peptidase n=1 Tax=unclassified Streptomyces TaxID=2593676 RepID=UPI0028842141|nr:C39 family peptidase [Streptomyces sp. DSM 41633]